MRKTVDFEAHKTVRKPTKVSFTRRDGERVAFRAKKATKVPVHVRFKTHVK